MFSLIRKLIVTALVLGGLALGYMLFTSDSAEAREFRQRAGDAFDAGRAWVAQTWEEFQAKKDPEIRELEQRLATLRAMRDDATGLRRIQLDELCSDLERQLAQARSEMESARDTGDEAQRHDELRHVDQLIDKVRSQLDQELGGGEGR